MEPSKHDLRAWATARRDSLSSAERAHAADRIAARVIAHPAFGASPTLLVYAGMRSEVDTARIIKAAAVAGKTLVYPSIDWTTRSLQPTRLRHPELMAPGRFGVPEPAADDREPIDPAELALVLVPGLLFDQSGHRLGYGAGMFDGLLAQLPATCLCWGLAYEAQVVDVLPREPHDCPVDAVVTESRWLRGERCRE